MKLINKNNTTGGRPLFLNDILTVEENFYKHSQAQFQNQGAFIISGVISTQNNISPGVVIIDNEVMSFEGAAGVSFPVYLVREQNFVENVTFQDGITRPLYVESKAVISTTIPSNGEYISITANGGKRYTDVLMNELVGLKGNQTIAGNKTFQNTVTVAGYNVKNTLENLDQQIANLKQYVDQELNKKINKTRTWINLTIQSGWTAISSEPLQYSADGGEIALRGAVRAGTGTSATISTGLSANTSTQGIMIRDFHSGDMGQLWVDQNVLRWQGVKNQNNTILRFNNIRMSFK